MRAQARDATPPAATRALERRLGEQAVVDLDPVTRTPRVLARLDGALSGPARGPAKDVALRYVRANLAALGLQEADLDTLRPPVSETVGGITTVRWRQAVDGIAAADSELRVNVDRDGRMLSVLGSPAAGLDPDTTPALTAGEAVRVVQDDVGVHRVLPRRSGGARSATYADGTTAALAFYTGRLAWRVSYRAGDDAVYDVMVDARSGKLLRRANLVKSAVMVSVWDDHPVGDDGGATNRQVPVAAHGDPDPWLADTTKLLGPNVHAYLDANDDGDPQPADEVAPDAYDFVPLGGCAPLPCSWTDADKTTNRSQNAVQAFYFANRFHDHLRDLGFTDRSFKGADRLLLEASDGADVGQGDNAYMYTPPNGKSPVMQLQLWSRERNVNAGDDASIVYHEYTHGLSNRLITDAAGAGALNSPQAGAMGEGWSDWYAKDFLDPVDTAAEGEIHLGDYVGRSIRKQGLDCSVGGTCPAAGSAGFGGFTYGDYGKVAGFPEIHADGEIWAQTLWDLREALGTAEARRVVTGGMRLTPPEPSFLDARNAILLLAADAAQRAQMWTVFARRGMGYYASTAGAEDLAPREDFAAAPLPHDGAIEGVVADAETGSGILGATVRVGGSSDLVSQTGGDGRYTMTLPRRAYPSVVFTAPGYDRIIKPVTVGVAPATLSAELRRNWASYATGARSSGGEGLKDQGCGSLATLDGLPGSTWSVNSSAEAATMIVTLPGPVNVRAFGVDPTEGCMDSDAAAAGAVLIETSSTSANGPWTTAANPTFTAAHRRRMNLVPAQADGVRFVRVTIQSTQRPSLYRDISEFGVYSSAPAVEPTPTPTPLPTAEPTATATAEPTPVATAPPPPATPTPTPSPTGTPQARPAFVPRASGKRAIKVRATCPAECAVRAEVKVDVKTAKRLGSTRTVGKFRRTLRAGTTTFTVNLSSKAKHGLLRKVKSFKATLKVSSGSVTTARKITIKR